MDGRDGRKFTLSDPHNLVALFNAGGVDLPIDYEHQSDKPSAGPIPAAGWVKELRVESDGLWGRVEWTATASQMIAGKEYRYISPSFLHRKDGEVVRIKGAGLVHKPNLYLTALASEETNMTDQNQNDAALFPKIAELLNLPADTDMNTLIAALQKALSAIPDPAKYVPIEAVAEIMKDRNVQSANMSEMAVQQKVDSALRDGYITPAMRVWATALCTQDASSFETFIHHTGPTYAHLFKPSHMAGKPPSSRDTALVEGDMEAAVCAQLGLAAGTLNS